MSSEKDTILARIREALEMRGSGNRSTLHNEEEIIREAKGQGSSLQHIVSRLAIREALQKKGQSSENSENSTESNQSKETPCSVAACLPAVGATFDERLALFASNAATLAATFHNCASRDEALAVLNRIAADEAWKVVASHAAPVLAELAKDIGNGISFFPTDKPYDKASLEKCDASLTTCECLVAQTGSVMVSSAATGGRALSVLPPHHVVIATRDQLLPDLAAAYAFVRGKYGDKLPSMVSFITGPSRTGDIERILVLGVHGPRKLTVILVP